MVMNRDLFSTQQPSKPGDLIAICVINRPGAGEVSSSQLVFQRREQVLDSHNNKNAKQNKVVGKFDGARESSCDSEIVAEGEAAAGQHVRREAEVYGPGEGGGKTDWRES